MATSTPSWAEPLDSLDAELSLLLDSSSFDVNLLLSEPLEPKKRRKRPRDCLVSLRAEVAALNAELAARRRAALLERASERTQGGDCGKDWETLALRQERQLEAARATNSRLRATLEGQVALAKHLHAALQQHCMLVRVGGLGPWLPSGRLPPPSKDEMAKSAELFKALTSRTSELYERVDDALAAAQFITGGETSVVKTSNGLSYLEITDARRLPFDLEAVYRAQWRGLSICTIEIPNGAGRLADIDQDTFHYVYYEPLQPPRFPNCTTMGKMAIRRFIEPGRVVIIWAAVVIVNGDVHWQIHEDGWVVTTPSEGRGHESALVQSLGRLIPQISDSISDGDKDQPSHMMDFVLGNYRRNVKMIFETMENELLSDSRISKPMGGEQWHCK